ncbi:hypothetical protein ACHAXT_000171 [Thalassiosira profunda]
MAARFSSKILSLIGPPGSGKGTYGELLAARFNGTCLNIGEILRERSIEDNELRATMRSGGMVSDEYINDLLIPRLKNAVADNDMVILDCFPRNAAQTKLLREWPKNLRPTMAIQFDVPDEVCMTKQRGRRKCKLCGGNFNINGVDSGGFHMPPILPKEGACNVECNPETDWAKRDDDAEDVIAERMRVYHAQTDPIVKFWKSKGTEDCCTSCPTTGCRKWTGWFRWWRPG